MKLDAPLHAAEWSLRLMTPEQLVGMGVQALVEGRDGKALVELAGLTNARGEYYATLQKLASSAFEELGVKIPPIAEAAILLTRRVCSQIVAGQMDPVEGAIWVQNHIYCAADHPKWLIPFIGPAIECEGRPDQHDFYRPQILRAARDFLSGHRS